KIGLVIVARTRCTIIAPARAERDSVECNDGRAIPGAEAQMAAARGDHGSALLRDRELDAGLTRCGAIIGALACAKIDDANQAKRPKHGIVECAAARDVADPQRNMIEHCDLRRMSTGIYGSCDDGVTSFSPCGRRDERSSLWRWRASTDARRMRGLYPRRQT